MFSICGFIVESESSERKYMSKAPSQLQESIANYYKELNQFLKQREIQDQLAKLRELSNKANNK